MSPSSSSHNTFRVLGVLTSLALCLGLVVFLTMRDVGEPTLHDSPRKSETPPKSPPTSDSPPTQPQETSPSATTSSSSGNVVDSQRTSRKVVREPPQEEVPRGVQTENSGGSREASTSTAQDIQKSVGREKAKQPLRMEKEEVREIIQGMKPRVRTCYETLLKDFPNADGQVLLSFSIVSHDDTLAIDLESVKEDSSLYEKELNACLLDALRELDLPEAEGSGELRVTYPFSFVSEDPDDEKSE